MVSSEAKVGLRGFGLVSVSFRILFIHLFLFYIHDRIACVCVSAPCRAVPVHACAGQGLFWSPGTGVKMADTYYLGAEIQT